MNYRGAVYIIGKRVNLAIKQFLGHTSVCMERYEIDSHFSFTEPYTNNSSW